MANAASRESGTLDIREQTPPTALHSACRCFKPAGPLTAHSLILYARPRPGSLVDGGASCRRLSISSGSEGPSGVPAADILGYRIHRIERRASEPKLVARPAPIASGSAPFPKAALSVEPGRNEPGFLAALGPCPPMSAAVSTGRRSSQPEPSMGGGVSVSGAKKPVIPDFEMMRTIGRGSYGDVWLARGLTGVYRAVKVVWRDR